MAEIANETQQVLKRKIGPLPAWGWGLVFVGATGTFLFIRMRSSNASPPANGGAMVPIGDEGQLGGISNPPAGNPGRNPTPPATGEGDGLRDWLAPILTLIAQGLNRPATPPASPPITPTTPPVTTPPPSGGVVPPITTPTPSQPINQPPAQQPIPAPQVPPSNVSGVIRVPGGAVGIPQSMLRNGTFNIVRLEQGLHVNALEGWTAWAPPSSLFSDDPNTAESANPNGGWQQWASGEYIPAGGYVALLRDGAAMPGMQPR